MIIQSDCPDDNMSFQFHTQPIDTLEDKKLKELLQKWGIGHSFRINSYLFDLKFEAINAQKFLIDLFNSEDVRSSLPYFTMKQKEFIQNVKCETLTCKSINMDMFDKLEEDRIVVNGHIKGMFEEFYEGIQIADELRACLVLEESEHYCVFNENDRQELLFRIFQLLVLGGQMCQYEDKIDAYLEQTKYLYKNLVNARKRPDKEEIYLDTYAYSIKQIDKVYSQDHPQSQMIVIVNPSLRVVNIISNKWIKIW